MIPRDFITEWRVHAPWKLDAQVEQDLVISRALVELFRAPELADSLAFRGATALYELHLLPPARCSEDIDLVQVTPGPTSLVPSCLARSSALCTSGRRDGTSSTSGTP
ncbi:MAG TPA: nucleotidyl transferase AbiEii/AbiGii toxin family protein [Longimicrobiales bacterium]|nr:nucleotidyl transferase AbiEii/AbiGii toxin family protein [Longimicrobiales bacterium]